jgi:hypothetical protein
MKRRELLRRGLVLGAALSPLKATGGATLAGRVTEAGTGQILPCSVRIEAIDGSVVKENDGYQSGFRSNGEFLKHLPPGKMTVTISRGFDYVAVREDVVLATGQTFET